jgi:hypothetical protein
VNDLDEKSLLGDKKRRNFFRHACDASVTSAFEYDSKDKWNRDVHSGYLKSEAIGQSGLRVLNISEGGIALISRFPALKGAVVSLKISTAFDTTIRAQARVVWAKRPKTYVEAYVLAFEFLDMSREDARNLNNLLKMLRKTAPAPRNPFDRDSNDGASPA